MKVTRKYLRSYLGRREAEAFVDGVMAAGWQAAEVVVEEEESTQSRWGVQYVVYRLIVEGAPSAVSAPSKFTNTPRRRVIR